MGCWVASEKHSSFLGVYIGINPLGPGVESSPKGIMDIQLTVHAVALLVVIFPVAHFKTIRTVKGKWNAGCMNCRSSVNQAGHCFAHPREVLSCVHQWPVLKIMISAFLYLGNAESIMSSLRVSRVPFPLLIGISHSWTRKGERKNSTLQL